MISGGAENVKFCASPSGSMRATSPTPSTWPCTQWPPIRSPTRRAGSRFTRSPAESAAERGAPQGLCDRVELEHRAVVPGHRETAAVDRHRVADACAGRDLGRLDLEVDAAVGRLARPDLA